MATRSRRAVLLGLGAAGLGFVGYAYWSRTPSTPLGQTLSPEGLLRALEEEAVIVIDIRRPDEWRRSGVIAQANLIDMRRPDFVAALAAIRAAQPELPVAIICARGVRSARVFQALTDAGVQDLVDVPEGMLGSAAGPGWIARGLPVATWNG